MVSPILVRPVREQLEHDRIIRLLPGRYRRRFEVGINPGSEQAAPIGSGAGAIYPDAVLYSTDRGRKVVGVVEVETGESINHLEAMAEWAAFGRLKVPFHLYVPIGAVDVARRLSSDHQIPVSEIWTYDQIGDQVRFTLVHKAPEPQRRAADRRHPVAARTKTSARKAPRTPRTATRPRQAAAGRSRPAVKAAKRTKAAPARKAGKAAARKASPAAKRR
jgi:hypothetical protein